MRVNKTEAIIAEIEKTEKNILHNMWVKEFAILKEQDEKNIDATQHAIDRELEYVEMLEKKLNENSNK